MSENEEKTEGKKQRLRSAGNSILPIASVIPDKDTFQSVVKLLREATKLKARVSEDEERLSEIVNELAAVAMAYDLKGMRHGLSGFEYRGYSSRKSLNKQKLVERMSEYGAPASLIDDCYETGKDFLDARITIFDME